MKLYLISQTDNDGWDTYSDAVVAARSEDEARTIHPNGETRLPIPDSEGWRYSSWVTDPSRVTVELIGTATPGTKVGVICSSFHAG